MAPESSAQVAAKIAPAVNPGRLRLAREARGWTQAELTARLAEPLSSAAVSQLENGRTRPTGPTLLALATTLEFPLEFFLLRDGDDEAPGFFRKLQSAPARERRRALACAQLLYDLASAVGRHVRLPDLAVPRRTQGPRDSEDIEEIAAAVRAEWKLGDGPVRHVVRELERHGIVVARFTMERTDVDGFSVWHPDRPVVVLGEDKGIAARSRFDAAHELAHLVLHGPERAGTREAEKEAHRFAAAFLMPERDIRSRLPARADWRCLIDLKAEWGVSIGALIQRAKDLKVMGDHAHLNAMKAMSARGWRIKEPGDELLGAPERPVLLERALKLLEREHGLSLTDIAEEAALPAAEIRRLVGLSVDTRPVVEL